jgi:hypothetical protein
MKLTALSVILSETRKMTEITHTSYEMMRWKTMDLLHIAYIQFKVFYNIRDVYDTFCMKLDLH